MCRTVNHGRLPAPGVAMVSVRLVFGLFNQSVLSYHACRVQPAVTAVRLVRSVASDLCSGRRGPERDEDQFLRLANCHCFPVPDTQKVQTKNRRVSILQGDGALTQKKRECKGCCAAAAYKLMVASYCNVRTTSFEALQSRKRHSLLNSWQWL